jgi:hypothetical protein
MRIKILAPLAILTLILALFGACELDSKTDAKTDTGGPGTDTGADVGPTETWTVIRIIDKSPPDDTTKNTPGADIDKISVEDANGNTVACGCPTDVRLDPSPPMYPANPNAWHNDVNDSRNDLCTQEADVNEGYVSLGGSNLWCDIGKPLKDGYHILVWEVHATATRPGQNDPFSVDMCKTMDGPCLDHKLASDVELTGSESDHADIVIDEGL